MSTEVAQFRTGSEVHMYYCSLYYLDNKLIGLTIDRPSDGSVGFMYTKKTLCSEADRYEITRLTPDGVIEKLIEIYN